MQIRGPVRTPPLPHRRLFRLGVLGALLMASVGCYADERLRRAEQEATLIQRYPPALVAALDRPDSDLLGCSQP